MVKSSIFYYEFLHTIWSYFMNAFRNFRMSHVIMEIKMKCYFFIKLLLNFQLLFKTNIYTTPPPKRGWLHFDERLNKEKYDDS